MSRVVARRYARALYDVAVAHCAVERQLAELDGVQEAVRVCPDLGRVLAAEEYPLSKRERVIDAVAAVLHCSTITTNFMKILTAKRRIAHFPAIVELFRLLAAEQAGEVTAEVTTTVPLSDRAVVRRLQTVLEHLTKRKVALVMREDAALLGGMTVRIGDEVFDGSVRTELHRVRERLLNA